MARRLCFEERVRIEAMTAAGLSAAEAARRLGRHRTTVQRELGRGGPGGYDAEAAQAAACIRAARPRAPKLAEDAELAAAVCERLAQRWSPQAISADLRTLGLRVCAETINRACYDRHSRRGLPPNSWRLLPRRRRRRSRRQSRARPLGERPGHRTRQPHRHRHPRRKNKPPHPGGAAVRRLQRPRHSPGGHSRAGPPARPHGQNPDLGHIWSIQGREMARWADIEKNLGITVYFCEPRSPWQRPTNEQTNGLLRRWFPKSTDLDIGAVRLAVIEDHLNTMPRRIHNWTSAQTAYTD